MFIHPMVQSYDINIIIDKIMLNESCYSRLDKARYNDYNIVLLYYYDI